MTVQDVRVAIDTVADRITGQVPVGQGALARFATLRVYLVGATAPRTVVAVTNAAGEFSVDPANPGLRAQPFSLGAVRKVEAVHTLPEGHQTIATATPRWQVWLPYGLKPR